MRFHPRKSVEVKKMEKFQNKPKAPCGRRIIAMAVKRSETPRYLAVTVVSPFGRKSYTTISDSVAQWGLYDISVYTFEGLRYASNPSQ